ncbi:hypothetical protein P4475_18850 [Halalkalibacterium halodurans]|jgi:hypothetical protein|uniref:hypothetical protein n=1 Tax=Halalkalibacterium halodurans TaxID=86665 RepID=UPI000AD0422E|nr:hypothetical protein [Halalkalibacterium halodurans]MDY7222478.1 hypothetical protein [Halalkalibacterium halodurans]MDY7241699.1 hypothetical protein [Halalkalibacterium halodurans]MED3648826.1 hypothetical protein [Halalkalibacterium halodurans]MED4164015.1 hypothetical protein [Halalkalibacterium halodurans]
MKKRETNRDEPLEVHMEDDHPGSQFTEEFNETGQREKGVIPPRGKEALDEV